MKECPACGLNKMIEEVKECSFCEGEGCVLCKETGEGRIANCLNKDCILNGNDNYPLDMDLKVFFSFTKECEDITFRAELATDDNKNYVLFLSDHDGAAVYPFEKEELKVVYNAIGKILGNNN